MTNRPPPFLSLVCAVGNASARDTAPFCRAALEFNHRQLALRGVSHEILFVELADDDGPRYDQEWARRVCDLSEGTLTEFVIDSRYGAALPMRTMSSGAVVLTNVGIRRARGAFVLCVAAGIGLGRRLMDRIASARLEPGIVYRAPRVDVRMDAGNDKFGWGVFEEPQRVTGARLADPIDFVMLDRSSLHGLRGFTELSKSSHTAVGYELIARAEALGYPVQSLTAPVYVAHDLSIHGAGEPDGAGRAVGRHPNSGRRVGYVNPDTWGLAAAPERTLAPHRVWLDFDWRAVERLVDFSRVMQMTNPV